jgi:hypothetical protein
MDAAAQCATCGAPMAPDQRYCLQCGSRAAHLPGVRGGLRGSAAAGREERPEGARGVDGQADPPTVAGAGARANNTISVIAGVGVLLLAMGIGVLIGRANSSSASKAAAAPQVISVATPAAGTDTTSTAASTTPAVAPTKKPAKSSSPSPSSSSSSSSSSGVGQVPSKPAPPSVLKNLHTGGSGQNYEQKSKNLPNVVSTG